ncbi:MULTISPECIES: bifunctional (p)ppGpp synthetase/guanosine-3',5'-bis(diphosphate) 3'-pyrophosphohydrolase [unclassified Apibacter]|uniref:RelA/SpoT family protein n=1 Tax=unclassified Apibacter TaxID=2630820 RepID=UPI00132B5B93|nr:MULTISPECIES: RelA/SpoT family protein [unclassified Apibacter]MCX8676675.1 bifunctional (p)ppGpp synthetase/guanosine-3',5'-bis(diphosphate) 3'-pyrophosphohydrolase [Apibacter sp. B3919]MXO24133.1 RelA/SpoT family protein [Apibacter sp. B3924]MXO26186.1 RelA/SpoT family protein [Apibacter sp. B3813]MXO28137.1 RelA/SpoT family protein [Apibacter sp. B3913]MXO30091.1 RelA/SpoT family protein [Apibacter sp. B3912]
MDEIDLKKEEEIVKRYKDMLRNTYRDLTTEDKSLIRKAFEVAKDAHKDQRRKTGEPYIYHPLAVAKIVADEIGLGATSIACALLHDVVEDTQYTIEDISNLFNPKVAKIIDGLTKISNIDHQNLSLQSENYRKLLLTLSEDVRVILIKIADRLHNMRTLDSMKSSKQKKIAAETTYIYAPLAHRMGLYTIKSELEDLSLKYTDPESYSLIVKKLEETEKDRQRYIEEFSRIMQESLNAEGLNFTIKGRHKSVFSIYKKMKKQDVSFEEVFDLFAIRIIYKSDYKNEKFLAWKIYSIVTDKFMPNPSRMRDWITTPRSTGYESLHVTVIGPESKWVEVQIRSERMDELAEKGIAAHYKYKEGYKGREDNQIENWISQVREMLENLGTASTKELLDDFKLNLYTKDIFVFTPKGDLKVLSAGATALDFAYSVHSGIGDHCLGAKVNNKLVPLSYKLSSGDQVEILTSNVQKPKADWLDFVATSKAKSRIKAALNSEKRTYTEEGKELLIRKLRHLKINFSEEELNSIQKFFGAKTSHDVFYQVATGVIDSKALKKYRDSKGVLTNLLSKLRKRTSIITENNFLEPKEEENYDMIVFGDDEEKLNYQLAQCCNPIPGDNIFGFVTINSGIKVHKESCSNAIDMRANYDYRVIPAKWVSSSSRDFLIEVSLQGIDRNGIFNDITTLISNKFKISIKKININSEDGIFYGNLILFVKNTLQLEQIIEELHNIEGITNVKRSEIKK